MLYISVLNLEAQTLIPTVFATNGGYSDNGGYSLSWTAGETIFTTLESGNSMLSQGFQQPNKFFPLPVTIIDFNAIRSNKQKVVLTWRTAEENNNKGFDIERKLENEINFTNKDFAPSLTQNGNSTSPLTYTYNDPNDFSGISYYRLKQWDKDGQSTYTIIKAVNGINNASVSLVVFPNPNNGQFKIIVEGVNQPAICHITDINGKLVKKLNFKNGQPVFVSNLASGTYIVTIIDAFGKGKSFSEKIIVGK